MKDVLRTRKGLGLDLALAYMPGYKPRYEVFKAGSVSMIYN